MFASAASPESSVGAAGVDSPSDGSQRAPFSEAARRGAVALSMMCDAQATHRARHDDALSLDSDGDAAGATNLPSGSPMVPSARVSGGVGVLVPLTGNLRLVAVTPADDRGVELNRAVHAKFKGNLLAAKRASPPQQASPALAPLTGLVPSTAVTPAVDRGVELNRAVHAKFKRNLLGAKR
jgi:hypothetical protein